MHGNNAIRVDVQATNSSMVHHNILLTDQISDSPCGHKMWDKHTNLHTRLRQRLNSEINLSLSVLANQISQNNQINQISQKVRSVR